MNKEATRALKSALCYILSIMLIVGGIPISQAAASSLQFSINPAYVSNDELPRTITITANTDNTFTEGSAYPIILPVLEGGAYGAPQTLSIQEANHKQMTIMLPSSLVNGKYELRVGDSKGTVTDNEGYRYYLVGTFIVANGSIEGTAPLVSLPKGYDSVTNVTVTGKYTNFSTGQSRVEVRSGTQVVANPSVVNVTNVDNYTRQLTFALNTGLDTGDYDIRIISGTEVLEKQKAIRVRGIPAISIENGLILNEGYEQTTVRIIGNNTGFNSATTVAVTKDGEDTETAGTVNVTNATNLSFSLATGLNWGTYEVTVKTGVEEATSSFVINSPQVDLKRQADNTSISRVGHANNTIAVSLVGTNTNFDSGLTQISVLNSSQQDVTDAEILGAITFTGQSIRFSINRSLPIGEYTLRAVTGDQQVEQKFEIVEPIVESIVFNANVYSKGNLASGYASHPVRVDANFANFSDSTTVVVQGHPGYISAINNTGENMLEFILEGGLTPGTYEVVIDMDGNMNTSNDRFTKNNHANLAFTVTEPSILSVSPNVLINAVDEFVTVSVAGQNTHFAIGQVQVNVLDSSGMPVGLISDINASNNENLTFKIDPSSIETPGIYNLEVEAIGGGFVERVVLNNALEVTTSGIGNISPSYVYYDQLGEAMITLTGEGTNFTNNTLVRINGVDVSSTAVNQTTLTFVVPVGLALGDQQVQVIEVGMNPYNTSFLVRGQRDVAISPTSKTLDYKAFDMFMESQNIDLSVSHNVPNITISGPSGFNQIIGASAINVQSNNMLSFAFPVGGSVGNYQVTAGWTTGEHAGISFTKDFIVEHKYKEVYFTKDNNIVTSVTKVENEPDFQLQAWGKTIADGMNDVNITGKVTWSVITGSDVISVSNGVISMKKPGNAKVQIDYDNQTRQLTVVVNQLVIPEDPEPGDGTTPPGDGTTPPGDDTTPPGDGTTPPGDGTTPPGDGTTPPGDDTTLPGDDTTSPGDDTTPPGDDTTPPGGGTTPPGDNTSPPADDTTPPGEVITPGDNTPPGDTGGAGISADTLKAIEDLGNMTKDDATKKLTEIVAELGVLNQNAIRAIVSAIEEVTRVQSTQVIDENGRSVVTVLENEMKASMEAIVSMRDVVRGKVQGDNERQRLDQINVSIHVDDPGESFYVPMTASTIGNLNNNKVGLKIASTDITMTIPADAISNQQLSVSTEIEIGISRLSGEKATETRNLVVDRASNTNKKPAGDILEFTIQAKNQSGQATAISQFNKKITITTTVPLATIQELNDVRKAAFYYILENGELEFVGGNVKGQVGSFRTNHFSQFMLAEYDKIFVDIHRGWDWAVDFIEVLASKHIINGVTDDSFNPSGTVTRAQFATLLGRALELEEEVYDATVFSDVSAGQYYTGYVLAMNRIGLLTGYGDGTFGPNDSISRDQMATLIMRTYQYVSGESVSEIAATSRTRFADHAEIAPWAIDHVLAAQSLGFIDGMGNNTFAPKATANRAQAAKLIYMIFITP